MHKRVLTIFLALILLCSLSACAKVEEPLPPAEDPYAGFESEGPLSGGGSLYKANLCSLTAREDGTDVLLTLDFLSDSRISDGGAERSVGNPPRYSVYMLGAPARLVVEFESITYFDYVRDLDLSGIEAITGVFADTRAGSEEMRLFIHLSGETVFTAAVDGSTINIHLRPVVKAAEETTATAEPTQAVAAVDVVDDAYASGGEAYYAVANEYREYSEGIISLEGEMTPCLASDGETVLLISTPYPSKGAAEALMEKLLSREANAVRSNWRVVLLKDGELPAYDESMDYMAAYDALPARIGGTATALDTAIPDGLALAVTPDKSGVLYSKRVSERETGAGFLEYERLCIFRGGESKAFVSFEFQTIESAEYSPDGRKLAVLERSGESAHLYVFDVDSRDLITDLSGVGFGDTVSAYVWDTTGGRIFSIGGAGEIAVHQYDFNVPNESKRHTVVDKKGVDEGSLAFVDGEVYFTESEIDGAVIFRVKPEGGLRRTFMDGDIFKVSPDGTYMAYSTFAGDYSTESDKANAFAILDLASGVSTAVTGDFPVYTFLWSLDGSTLYYVENRLSGGQSEGEGGAEDGSADGGADAVADPYPYTLWAYTVATGERRAVADIESASLMASASADTVYLCYRDGATMGDVVRATYAIKVK